MLILTIDTTTDISTLGLLRDGALLASAAFPSRHTLAKRMLTRMDWLLADAGLTKHDLEAIAVTIGPGSFTGVRLGPVVAKTLAHGLHIPLVGLSTLEALAYPYRDCPNALLVPVVNARRQQVYLALYRSEYGVLRRVTDDLALSAGAYAEELARHRDHYAHILLIGLVESLPLPFHTEAPAHTALLHSLVTPEALAALAEERLARGAQDDPMTLAPVYLRPPAD